MIRKGKDAAANGTDNTAANGEQFIADMGNTDPYSWMQDFDATPEQLATRGEPIGHMRFVAFQPAEKQNIALMLNLKMNEGFLDAMVQYLANDDDAFQVFEEMVDRAKMYREIKTNGIGSVLQRLFGGVGHSRSPFAPGGMSFGESDELFCRRRGSANPLSDLSDLIREITGGEGCDCPQCTELRERNAAKSAPGTDDKPGE